MKNKYFSVFGECLLVVVVVGWKRVDWNIDIETRARSCSVGMLFEIDFDVLSLWWWMHECFSLVVVSAKPPLWISRICVEHLPHRYCYLMKSVCSMTTSLFHIVTSRRTSLYLGRMKGKLQCTFLMSFSDLQQRQANSFYWSTVVDVEIYKLDVYLLTA